MLIFEYLDFDDLVNVAQLNAEFSSNAAAVFHREYCEKNFWIYRGFLLSNNSNELMNVGMEYDAKAIEYENEYFKPATVKLSEEYVKLEYGAQILNVFKHFGHLIKRITLGVGGAGQRAKLMARLISKYSSESLVDVKVGFWDIGVLNYITKPLVNVENLTLTFESTNENRRPIGINERFPALRRLYLHAHVAIRGFAYFSYLIPHLEDLEISGAIDESKTFEGLISNNPQIRSIKLSNIKPRFVQELNNLLPQLETLALNNFELDNTKIRFENVSTLSIDYHYFGETSPDANLEFPQLQTLHIDNYRTEHFVKHHTFMKKLNNLKQLHLTYWKMPDSEFQQLTQNLTNLVDLTLKCFEYKGRGILSANAVAEFAKNHDKLQQLNVINLFKDQELQVLRDQLDSDWQSKINGHELSFKRNK